MRHPEHQPILLGGGSGAIGLALLLGRFQVPALVLIGPTGPPTGAAFFSPLQVDGAILTFVHDRLPHPALLSRIHVTRGKKSGSADLPIVLRSWSRDALTRVITAAATDRISIKTVPEIPDEDLGTARGSQQDLMILCHPEWLPLASRSRPARRWFSQIIFRGGATTGTRIWHLLPHGSIDVLEMEDSKVLVTFRGLEPTAAFCALDRAREDNLLLREQLNGAEICSELYAFESFDWMPRAPHIGSEVFLLDEGSGLVGSLPWIGDAAWLRNAEIAAPLLFECVRGRSSRKAALAGYVAAWRQEFVSLLSQNRRLQALLLGRSVWALSAPREIARSAAAALRPATP